MADTEKMIERSEVLDNANNEIQVTVALQNKKGKRKNKAPPPGDVSSSNYSSNSNSSVSEPKFTDARDDDIHLEDVRVNTVIRKKSRPEGSSTFSIIAGSIATVIFLGGVAAVAYWQYNNQDDLINKWNEFMSQEEQQEIDELKENEQYGTYEFEVSSVIDMDRDADGEDYLEDETRSGAWVDSYINQMVTQQNNGVNQNNPDMSLEDRQKLWWINEDFAVTDIQFRSLEDDFDESETTIRRQLRARVLSTGSEDKVGSMKFGITLDAKELLGVDTAGEIVV